MDGQWAVVFTITVLQIRLFNIPGSDSTTLVMRSWRSKAKGMPRL